MLRSKRMALALGTAVGVLALASTTGAQAEPPPASESTGLYIVQTAGVPVAAYEGGVPGYRSTRPSGDKGIDPANADVRRYRKYLADGRKAVLAKVPGAEKVYDYDTAFNGFAVRLTGPEAARLQRTPGVVHVWKSERQRLDTTSTPAFLGLTGTNGVWNQQYGGDQHAGEGVIVGIVDGGFWPENPSFAALPEPRPDADVIAQKWRGTCDEGADTPENNISCNNKVIGARYYGESSIEGEFRSPRDFDGHGSHVASTAAGNFGVDAVIHGASRGKLSGMAPAARLAVYKACWGEGCDSPDSVAAINQAVADGVDVINFSISGSTTSVVDPVEIAFYNAAKAGVFVATTAGNNGPGASTVAHNSPWATTTAAGTHDRAFRASATLGNGTTLAGAGRGDAVPQSDLVLSDNVGKPDAPADEVRLCYPGRLDPEKVAGKIVACARGVNARVDKSLAVQQAGGVGMILYNTSAAADDIASDLHTVPTVHVKFADSSALTAYAAAAGAKAALSKGEPYVAQAPGVWTGSSAGPALAGAGDLLKPDIMAPGVDVIAAVSPADNAGANFTSYQGTSMASPHIAGLAALVIGKRPTWDPTWVKSALMTTATQTDNQGQPIKRGNVNATPLDFGSGHVVPARAFNPGLVYASTPRNWVSYICAIGQAPPAGENCADVPAIDPSNLNYPTIAVGDLVGTQTVQRRLTNTTNKEVRYTADVVAPAGTTVTVTPDKLLIPAGGSVAVQVKITRTNAPLGSYTFGSLTWVDALGLGQRVRSPIAVRPIAASVPAVVSGNGTSGSAQITVKSGYDGTLNATVSGMVASTVTELPLTNPTGGTFPIAAPATNEHVGKVTVTVPEGSKVVRFATFDGDYADLGSGTDIDLYAYRKTATGRQYVGGSTSLTSNETVTLTTPGEYEVFVDLYALPDGVTTVSAKHHHWVLDTSAAGNLTVAPTSQPTTIAGSPTVTASWNGLESGTRQLGALFYNDGTTEFGRTLVSVTG